MVEFGGLLSTSPQVQTCSKSVGALLGLRKETENHLSWLGEVKAARLSAERSSKQGGEKRENEEKLQGKGRGTFE